MSFELALYNGMIAPLAPLRVKGFLWYQGESNSDRHDTYAERFIAMIRDWRAQFAAPQAPFYFVGLASYRAPLAWAFLREAQDRALGEPNTGRVVTLDIGDPDDSSSAARRGSQCDKEKPRLLVRSDRGFSAVCGVHVTSALCLAE